MVELLKQLIATPSVSRREDKTADILQQYLANAGLQPRRIGNNVAATGRDYHPDKPTLLLCSHHDTVQPSPAYHRDPYNPVEENGRLYGLGSNDAGGALVCMVEVFKQLQNRKRSCNLILVLSAEEEVSGAQGLPLALQQLPPINMAIVGEPTGMQAAIGERGLIVLDGVASGVSGHAAREEGENAIYKAIHDIDILRKFPFEKQSPVMGGVHLQVTQIEAGTQHNVVPDRCRFVVDVRSTDVYTNHEICAQLQNSVQSLLTPRSLHHTASATPHDSTLMQAIRATGIHSYISPTTSDWIHLSCPAVKIGPGDSRRSHTADEYILLSELQEGVSGYLHFLHHLISEPGK